MSEERNYDDNREVYSTVVKAGKRTYFFDVKSTQNDDLYLTVTESKRTFNDDRPSYKKHKIFLYKEDFEKFSEALTESINKINELKRIDDRYKDSDQGTSDYSSVDFDNL